eukprot:4466117-Amphidinium_carterae.1
MKIKRATSQRLFCDCADKNSAYGPTLYRGIGCSVVPKLLLTFSSTFCCPPPERREEEQNFETRERGHRENQFGGEWFRRQKSEINERC